ncbi:MAG TPA: aminotransferase class III-fold pyridoxal phosphate-dependent enzyme [Armatimonadota bacterium]|jgi:L-lysine 6-transaminase|nr:aminotransferase class III-fold pyridoxal phosphate-dependent enzyme [Armatimonadota bacterium]HOM84015.1 aminotransferase class III-fold pyridoxal phosphate-dependent enzyme [Armatimonadota bacterium]HPO74970.1 aminotransferase class III-fold pyridoxal phosphate-dependent enzyme [Armatimonadota bacterium]HPU00147.1 aminotransferase class III-fold pyridoxal phosphate-dependent enzyme [Armatimonadota bacterium]
MEIIAEAGIQTGDNNAGRPSFPGPASAAMIAELDRYVLADVRPFVIDLARCHGMWLATIDGQEIFDWAGYYASKLIGHNHPGLYEPEYVERLVRAANNKVANPDFLTPECLEYYRTLHRLAPECMRNPHLEVYAVNSGAEAVENMMKYFINLYHQRHGGQRPPDRTHRFLYFEQAFHGRTIFALSVTQTVDPVATKDFHGFIPGNVQVPFPAIDTSLPKSENRRRTEEALQTVAALLERFQGEVVGIVTEPIQGAGGHRCAEPEFFQGLSRLAHEHSVFLGFDEVQTAGGPTGALFMADQLDLPYPPQAIATAKKFGAGVVYMLHPMEDRGVLDSTWGGSLADMVRFVQEMKIVEREGLIPAAARKGELLADGLRALSCRFPELVRNVRGMGLYQGFSLPTPEVRARLIQTALQQENLLLLGAGCRSIRTRPNLSVTEEEIGLFLEKLERCLTALAG